MLISVYMLSGAAMFRHIERDSLMDLAEEAALDQRKASISLWNITATYNVLQPDTSRGLVSQALSELSSLSIKDFLSQVISEFQSSAVGRVGKGYTGREPGHRIWTFSSSLMFSMAIFTTIGQSDLQFVKILHYSVQSHHILSSGYGFQVPKTAIGKILSIFYALLGIPIMLLYSATIGSILASSFKFLYTKLCRLVKIQVVGK